MNTSPIASLGCIDAEVGFLLHLLMNELTVQCMSIHQLSMRSLASQDAILQEDDLA